MKWACGVTTVPERRACLLPGTLQSLAAAGFDRPRLFVDGARPQLDPWVRDKPDLEVTHRWPLIRTFGNWALGLAELYVREPGADRFAMFQDDLVAVRNLRAYLERCPYPERGYLNLYTFPSNQAIAPAGGGWYEGALLASGSGDLRFQTGRGAVALVFSREAVVTLLCSQHMIERPQDAQNGWKRLDGGVVTAMNKAGWREYVHSPSLVQHTGLVSSMRNRPHKQAESFPGEQFDALSLLSCRKEHDEEKGNGRRKDDVNDVGGMLYRSDF